jgi:hypothetical protein
VFKTGILGFLFGVLIVSTLWFVFGRIKLGEIFEAIERTDGDYLRVERLVSELGDNIDGLADEITIIREESDRSYNGIGNSIIRVGDTILRVDDSIGELRFIKSDIGYIIVRVDQLEEWNRQSVTGIRNLTNIAFEYRRLSEKSTTQ